MNRKKILKVSFLIIFLLLSIAVIIIQNGNNAFADELSDNINEELENLDLDDLERFSDELLLENNFEFNVISYIRGVLNGEYSLDYNSFFSYISTVFFGQVTQIFPVFLSVIAIAVFSSVISSVKGNFVPDDVSDLISMICLFAVLLFLVNIIYGVYENVKNVSLKISDLTEIVSPLVLTLMVASGGVVSAQIYQPVVLFLSNGITHVFVYFLIPLV